MMILSAASVAQARPVALQQRSTQIMPVAAASAGRLGNIDFDLGRSAEQSQAEARRHWLPPKVPQIGDLDDDDNEGTRFKFKGTKVKLHVPI